MTEGQHATSASGDRQETTHDVWQTCIEQLAQELPEQQFNTWIKPLSAVVAGDMSKVTIFVGNRFKLDWIRAQYSARISARLEKIVGQHVSLELALAPREPQAKSVFVPSVNGKMPIEEPAAQAVQSANSPLRRLSSRRVCPICRAPVAAKG